jgi:hypothetical protein
MQRCSLALEQLVDYHDGTAPPDVRAALEAHLHDGCAACAANLAWLAAMTRGLREAAAIVPPDYSLAPALALYRERRKPAPATALLARLVFDSRRGSALAGVRSLHPAAFQLLYATEVHDLDLWCEPQADGSWYVIGQALPREGEVVPQLLAAELEGEAGETQPAVLDGNEFHFPSVPSGAYTLDVQLTPAGARIRDFRLEP